MGTLKFSSIISKNSPVAPMLNDIGLEMSTAAPPHFRKHSRSHLLTRTKTAPAVALRSASRPESRLMKTLTVLENALIPRVSYNEVHLETLLVLTSQGPYRRDKCEPERLHLQ